MMQRTILVVDDEPEMRDVCRAALTREGFDVLEAEDGVEALALLERRGGDVDLVVSDAVMPRMGGRELIWEMSRRFPRIPVLLASGILADPDASYGLDVAPAAFVPKPFDPAELVRTVREALQPTPEPSGGTAT
ncbi:MAG TPA: response regulator [Longimicrobiaceae bacterium]|nr:response regulator [Longimicrobiaceae bacterium]